MVARAISEKDDPLNIDKITALICGIFLATLMDRFPDLTISEVSAASDLLTKEVETDG